VGTAIERMARSLAASGQARWYNPVWLFLRAFDRLFARITRGASRLQEVLADRYAALAYGADHLIAGLTQITRQGLTFHVQAGHEIDAALDRGDDVPNLFVLPPTQDEELGDRIEAAVEKEMSRATTPFDAHLAPRERIALLARIDANRGSADTSPADRDLADAALAEDAAPVWDLLADPAALQAEMMGVIKGRLGRSPVRPQDRSKETPQATVRPPLLVTIALAAARFWVRFGSRIRKRFSRTQAEDQPGDSG
jgi:hypothetical protein